MTFSDYVEVTSPKATVTLEERDWYFIFIYRHSFSKNTYFKMLTSITSSNYNTVSVSSQIKGKWV